jgi:hypothetical protein
LIILKNPKSKFWALNALILLGFIRLVAIVNKCLTTLFYKLETIRYPGMKRHKILYKSFFSSSWIFETRFKQWKFWANACVSYNIKVAILNVLRKIRAYSSSWKKGSEPCFEEYERTLPEDTHAYGEWVEGRDGPAAHRQLGSVSITCVQYRYDDWWDLKGPSSQI